MVPASSVYVPRLRAAFGFSCIDIVLQYTVDEDDIRRFNAQLGETKAEDISHCKRGEEGNLCSADAESKNRITCQRSALSGDRIARADCGNINSTAICATALVGPDRFGGVSLKMIDCDGVSVKFESIDRNLHDTILAKIIEVYNKTKSNTVQIFFKTICVKSSFANQITCLLATEMTEYVILRHPNVTPHEVRTFGSTSHAAVRFHSSSVSIPQLQHRLLFPHGSISHVIDLDWTGVISPPLISSHLCCIL